MFRESQQFRQKWLWAIIIFVSAGLLWPVIMQLSGRNTGPQAMPFYVSVLICIIPVAMILFMYLLRMETEITEEGVHFSFFPVVGKKLLPWAEVDTVFVRQYNAIMEYGGWGIRYTMGKRKGRALCVSGNMGMQLVMKDGKRLLLGTCKPDEAGAVLAQLAKKRIVRNEVISL